MRRRVIAVSLALLACAPDGATADEDTTAGGSFGNAAAGAPLAAPNPGDPPVPADGPEIVKKDSGLEYSVLAKGEGGGSPRMGDVVKVSYTGWLESGKVFDASARHGGPATFAVGGLIDGWNEALQYMSKGTKLKIKCPPKIAYGDRGTNGIPGGSTLTFVLELHDIVWAFAKPDAARAKSTPSGIVYEVLRAGAGDPPAADDAFELNIALWNAEGKLLQCTDMQGGPFKGSRNELALPFLKEAPNLLAPGTKALFQVPSELAFGERANGPDLPAKSTTYWGLELVRVIKPIPVPAFEMPADDQLKTTASGLKYQIVKEGTGKSPTLADEVTCHYTGWLTNGKVFDSSHKRGEPTTFGLAGVIPGWQEGLQLMKEGGVAKFVIPGNLAYGPRQAGSIPPNSTLVFLVELVKIGK